MSFHYCALTVIVKCCVYWLARGMSHWQLQTGLLLVKLTVMFNGDQWLWTVNVCSIYSSDCNRRHSRGAHGLAPALCIGLGRLQIIGLESLIEGYRPISRRLDPAAAGPRSEQRYTTSDVVKI